MYPATTARKLPSSMLSPEPAMRRTRVADGAMAARRVDTRRAGEAMGTFFGGSRAGATCGGHASARQRSECAAPVRLPARHGVF